MKTIMHCTPIAPILIVCVCAIALIGCASGGASLTKETFAQIQNPAAKGYFFGTVTRTGDWGMETKVMKPVARFLVQSETGVMYDLEFPMTDENKKNAFIFELPAGSYTIKQFKTGGGTFDKVMAFMDSSGSAKKGKKKVASKPSKENVARPLEVGLDISTGSMTYVGSIVVQQQGKIKTDQWSKSLAEDKRVLLNDFPKLSTLRVSDPYNIVR
ncbi:MAG TPA: hypothetical protein PKJ16_17665 [Spirochaetota bacterium]|nr:hypothetical protein [Spirochaetota bacterium]HPU88283.1 hypothetical protein [Spirochaetota bacterium]